MRPWTKCWPDQWYWSASGPVKNAQGSDGSEDNAYIRCIRDAYTNQTGD